MINDLRIAVRNLSKLPWFAVAFILTLGLGIGANTAIFSVINGVLLRPLPYPEADRIMHLRQPQVAAGIEDSSFSFAEVADYRGAVEDDRPVRRVRRLDVQRARPRRAASRHRRAGHARTSSRCSARSRSSDACCCRPTKARARRRSPCSPTRTGSACSASDPTVVGQMLDLTVKKAQIVGVLAPGAHYATAAQAGLLRQLRRQRSLHERVDAGRARASHDRRLRAAGAGRDARRPRRPSCGRSPRGCTRRIPTAYPKSRGFDTVVDAVEGRADREGEADADDPARHDGLRADHRVRERRAT